MLNRQLMLMALRAILPFFCRNGRTGNIPEARRKHLWTLCDAAYQTYFVMPFRFCPNRFSCRQISPRSSWSPCSNRLLNAVNCFCGFFDALFAHSAISFYFLNFSVFSAAKTVNVPRTNSTTKLTTLVFMFLNFKRLLNVLMVRTRNIIKKHTFLSLIVIFYELIIWFLTLKRW